MNGHVAPQVNGWRGSSPSESSVNTAMDAAIHTSLPTHGASSLGDSIAWRPKGILATHLVEHKKAVNRIAVAGNGAFFVTASDDETAKVWDCRRLERDVSFRSRLTISPKVSRLPFSLSDHMYGLTVLLPSYVRFGRSE